ncbi:MAG: DUF883 family protein [Burkholderiales bacterium]|jgi:ElaB/YqjD/DUF883 family membrane-anchored ribosome-binding protein|nr:DUF883 family protein [Burkholderiales bacterium]
MNETVQDAVTREKLVADMKSVIADADELLKATAGQAGEKVQAARTRAEESLRRARIKVEEAEQVVVARAKAAAQATDDYVHANPWKAVGLAGAIGVIVGMLIARR